MVCTERIGSLVDCLSVNRNAQVFCDHDSFGDARWVPESYALVADCAENSPLDSASIEASLSVCELPGT